MDWVSGIQKAIDYIEDNLTDDLDYGKIAEKAYSSSFQFQRVFGILCGMTLGEYIRARRLTFAGSELSCTDVRVIDVALKYGYDSPESFTRAFVKFHGITPSEAKKDGGTLKSFSPFSVKLVLDGDNTMDYRIEKKGAFKLIAKKKKVSCKEEMATREISDFWQQCGADGTIEALCKYVRQDNMFGNCIVGASFGRDAADADFPYGIGTPYNGLPVTDDRFTVEEIPAHTYVVFKCVGRMPEAFQKLYKEICSEFFPASEYQPCGGTDFEAYPSADVADPGYTCEIWISAEKK